MTTSLLPLVIAAAIWASPLASLATPVGDALQRPALQVAHPERAVLLSAARAGRRIVAVGERGIVMVSDDGGVQWRQSVVPTSVSLTAVQFVDDRRGWAVGHGGVVLASVDGGEHWSVQLDGKRVAALMLQAAQASGDAKALAEAQRLAADGPDKPFLDLYFADAQHGVVIGAYGLALSTEDGGTTWGSIADRLDNPGGLHLYAIQARGTQWLIAGEQGLALLSQDAGRSFHRLTVPYGGTFFRAAWLGDGALLLAGLRGQLWRSDDLGLAWQPVRSPAPVSFSATASGPDGTLWLANQAGGLFAFKAGQLSPVGKAPLPPTAGLLPLDSEHLLALTVRGAVIVPLSGARP